MAQNQQDMLVRAYAMLSSLRKNISEMTSWTVSETYVREFHTVLDSIENSGINVSEFRIPDSEMKPRLVSIPQVVFGESVKRSYDRYSKDKYVERRFMLVKMDAILGYLESLTSEKPKRIGFSTPDNQ